MLPPHARMNECVICISPCTNTGIYVLCHIVATFNCAIVPSVQYIATMANLQCIGKLVFCTFLFIALNWQSSVYSTSPSSYEAYDTFIVKMLLYFTVLIAP